jgi:hypothetical protein
MTTLQMAIVERHPGGRLVFNVRAQTDAGKLEFPISVEDEGTQAKNETTALRSVIVLAEAVAASARQRLTS